MYGAWYVVGTSLVLVLGPDKYVGIAFNLIELICLAGIEETTAYVGSKNNSDPSGHVLIYNSI